MTVYTRKPQLSQNVFLQSAYAAKAENQRCDLLQDNGALPAARDASGQPDPGNNRSHEQELKTIIDQIQNYSKNGQKLEKITAYVPKDVKAELLRLADQGLGTDDELSLSSVIAAFLVSAVQHNVNLQYGALLQPIIEKIIREEMRGFKTHLAWLLVRVAYDTGQTRSLTTNILNRQPGMDSDTFRAIVKESARAAKTNITRRTPQMTELIEAVERWMGDEGREQQQFSNGSRHSKL